MTVICLLVSGILLHTQPLTCQEAHSTIFGEVVGASRTEGLQLRLYRVAVTEGIQTLVGACSTQTDSAGRYRCEHLTPGRYLLSVANNNTATAPVTYYPSSISLDTAEFIQLRDGLQEVANVALRTVQTGTVELRPLVDPISSSIISFEQQRSSDTTLSLPVAAARKRLDSGRWLLSGVPVGDYVARVAWVVNGENKESRANVSLHVSGTIIVPIRDQMSGTVSIHLPADTPSSLPGSVLLTPEDPTFPTQTMRVDGAGCATTKNIPAGLYSLSSASAGALSSITVNGVAQDSIEVRIQPEASTVMSASPDFNLTSLQGITEDEYGKRGSAIVWVYGENRRSERVVVSDATGHFVISSLPQDQYLLIAWPPEQDMAYKNRKIKEALTKYAIEATTTSNLSGPITIPIVREPLRPE